MSTWYEAQDDDIDIDKEKSEVNILVTNDDTGNIYVTLSYDQICEIEVKLRGEIMRKINNRTKELGW